MSNPNFPQVGVDLQALNAAAFNAAVDNADKKVVDYGQKIDLLTVKYNDLLNKNEALIPQINRSALEFSNQSTAINVLREQAGLAAAALDNFLEIQNSKTGAAAVKAINEYAAGLALVSAASKQSADANIAASTQQITDRTIRLAIVEKDYTDALRLNAEALAEAAGDEARVLQLQIQRVQIQDRLTAATRETSNVTATGAQVSSTSQSNIMRDARGGRDAFFALGLALNLVITELGTNLPPAAKQAASGIKIVADSMLAGAYIGGGLGAILGALTGVLLTVGAAALAQDPNIKALNDSLDKLGKKDDAVAGLMKLTGVTEQNATDALAYVKANNQLADSFNAQIKATEPAIPVLQGIGDGVRDIVTALGSFNKLLEDNIPIVGAWHKALLDIPQDLNNIRTTTIFLETFKDALLHGADANTAMVQALQATQQAAINQGAALYAAKKQVEDYAVAQRQLGLNKSADTMAESLANAQSSLYDSMQSNSEAFYTKMADIAQNGVDARAAIEQTYANRIREIDETLRQARIDAYATYQQNVLDAEINASDRRITLANELAIALADAEEQAGSRRKQLEDNYTETIEKQAQGRAERLIQIQIAYQNAIEQIQDTYNQSIFNAISNQDAKALVQANMVREAALRKENEAHQQQLDAIERQRATDAANAKETQEKSRKQLEDALARQEEKLRDNYEKQSRALEESLRKQEIKLREEYEKRIKALEDAASKQKDAAGDARDKALEAQAKSQAKAEASERASYAQRQADLDRAYALKLRTIAKALSDEKDMTDANGRAIINSLRDILSPSQMQQILKDFTSAMNARIDINVTPLSIKRNVDTFAEGGYTGGRIGIVHPNELVLPLADTGRTQQLMQQYVPQRVMQSMPAWAQSRSNSNANVSGEIHVHVHMDNAMLGATVEQQISDTLLPVISTVHQNLARGY